MKITNLALLVALLAFASASAQDKPASTDAKSPPPPPGTLTRFDLDFKGGHPKDLVAAVQKATGKPLNALVSDEFANVILPELKVKNVTVPQLFRALEEASHKTDYVKTANNSFSSYNTAYGFRSDSGNVTDDTIWSFYMQKPNIPPPYKICRFYSLASYLDAGISVDDITTAIRTGAKMLGETDEPSMSFHKDTRLLIAVGEPSRLEIIDSALRALEPAAGDKPTPREKAVRKSGEEK